MRYNYMARLDAVIYTLLPEQLSQNFVESLIGYIDRDNALRIDILVKEYIIGLTLYLIHDRLDRYVFHGDCYARRLRLLSRDRQPAACHEHEYHKQSPDYARLTVIVFIHTFGF